MKRILYCLLILLFCLPGFISAEGDNVLDIFAGDNINNTQFVVINGENNPLYKTFKSRPEAIKKIKEEIPDFLTTLSQKYNLFPLSIDNWLLYFEAMNEYLNSETVSEKEYEEYVILRRFFDIFENTDKNNTILDYISNVPGYEQSADLSLMMPFYSPVAQRLNNQILSQPSLLAVFDKEASRDYAITYATSPNTPTYYYFSRGDCANFVSQILEAGGVKQEVYDSVHLGWWHKRKKVLWWYEHEHSVDYG